MATAEEVEELQRQFDRTLPMVTDVVRYVTECCKANAIGPPMAVCICIVAGYDLMVNQVRHIRNGISAGFLDRKAVTEYFMNITYSVTSILATVPVSPGTKPDEGRTH
jgi:hypothetical protein